MCSYLMDRNFSQGLVAGSAFSKSRLEESRRCKSTRSSRRFNAFEASTRYDGISRRLVLRTSGSEVIEALETVEADLELLYEVRRESYIIVPKWQSYFFHTCNYLGRQVIQNSYSDKPKLVVRSTVVREVKSKIQFSQTIFQKSRFYHHCDCPLLLGLSS